MKSRLFVGLALTYIVGVVIGIVIVAHAHLHAQTASQNNLLITLQQLDSSGTPILNRTLPKFSYNGAVGVFTTGLLTDTNAHSQTLPTTSVLECYFRNTHATANITVTWTPSGGASAVIKSVGPGGVLVFWETTGSKAITALSLQSDTASATFEMFLGG